jgi:hypothetical protein
LVAPAFESTRVKQKQVLAALAISAWWCALNERKPHVDALHFLDASHFIDSLRGVKAAAETWGTIRDVCNHTRRRAFRIWVFGFGCGKLLVGAKAGLIINATRAKARMRQISAPSKRDERSG